MTVLGDAIHAMAPSRGSGANLALLDAGRLCDALTGPGPLTAAIGRYETEMTRAGFAAVRASVGRLTRWRGRMAWHNPARDRDR